MDKVMGMMDFKVFRAIKHMPGSKQKLNQLLRGNSFRRKLFWPTMTGSPGIQPLKIVTQTF